MKLTTAITTALLAGGASAVFDKWSPWGKRDYACVNVIQGIPENATIAAGTSLTILFNRDTNRCSDYYDGVVGTPYNLWLYNNPNRNMGFVSSEYQRKVEDNIPEALGQVAFTIPTDLPPVNDSSVWYLRLDTSLPAAPQFPSLFYPMGPFTIE